MKLFTAVYITLTASLAGAVYIPIPIPPKAVGSCVLPCPSAAICIADPTPRCVVPNPN